MKNATTRKTVKSDHRPKINPAIRAWLAANGRKGGIATNNKRAKQAA